MEVGISIKGHRDQIGEDLWRDTFPGSNARLLILLGCLVLFFSAFCGRGKKKTMSPLYYLRDILIKFEILLNHLSRFSRSYVKAG